jgi:hypothetical protein
VSRRLPRSAHQRFQVDIIHSFILVSSSNNSNNSHPGFPRNSLLGLPITKGGARFESDPAYNDLSARRVCLSSRSSSSSDKSVPRKRSFTAGTSLPANVEERMFDALGQSMDIHTWASYDEVEMGYPSLPLTLTEVRLTRPQATIRMTTLTP